MDNETKLMIGIPVSGQLYLLELLLETIQQQYKVLYEYEVIIILNTLNEEVINEFINKGFRYRYFITNSNGFPGVGHQSVIDTFMKLSEFTHLMIIDGDDFLYPTALKVLPYPFPDILHIQSNDKIQPIDEQGIKLRYNLNLGTWGDNTDNYWINYNFANPYKTHISAQGTPTRMILISKKAIIKLKPVFPYLYFQNMILHDDYLCFLIATECQLNEKYSDLNVIFTSNTYIYLYNKINDNSTTRYSKEYEYNYDDKVLKYYPYEFIHKNEWNFMKLKHTKTNIPINFNKIEFINNLLEKYVNYLLIEMQRLFNEKKYNNFINIYKQLKKIGYKNNILDLNLGVCYYNINNKKKALKYFSTLPKTKEKYYNLFVIYKEENNKEKMKEIMKEYPELIKYYII